MDRQLKAVSLFAAGIALVALPLFSGRFDLAIEAGVILVVLLVVAGVVRGVRGQRDVLRQQNIDVGAIKKALRLLDEVSTAVLTPVLGVNPSRMVGEDSVTSVRLLARHGFTSIPLPDTDVEVLARLSVLCEDAQFMSVVRSAALRVAHRWAEFEVTYQSRLPVSAATLSRYLHSLAAAVSFEDLSDIYWPMVEEIRLIQRGLAAHLPVGD